MTAQRHGPGRTQRAVFWLVLVVSLTGRHGTTYRTQHPAHWPAQAVLLLALLITQYQAARTTQAARLPVVVAQ